jgi:hypothetical protein
MEINGQQAISDKQLFSDVSTVTDKDILYYVLGSYQSDTSGVVPDNRNTRRFKITAVLKTLHRVLYFLYTMKKISFNSLDQKMTFVNVQFNKLKLEAVGWVDPEHEAAAPEQAHLRLLHGALRFGHLRQAGPVLPRARPV